MRPPLLDEITLFQSGSFRRVRRFYEGWHPHLGVLHFGLGKHEIIVGGKVLRGCETIVDEDVVFASFTFEVADS